LNEIKDGSISSTDTMDVWAINVDSDKMYSIATQTDPLVFNAKNVLEMDVVDENGMSVLNSSPSGRYEKFGSILRAWTPEESGLYYVKIWGAPDALAAEADPSYAVRLWYGTPLDVAATEHEPDDEVADASALPAVPTDGTVMHGYLYNNYTEGDTFSTNWNDLDLYKVEIPEDGMVLIAETTTPGRLYGHPEWIRETDTEITLLDATGAETPIKNDDKDVWAGDPWEDILTFNNTFSRFVSPPVPSAGTYYIRVNSYYNSVTRSRNPHESHKNAGGGEYLLSVKVVPPDDPSLMAEDLPLNEIKDGSISDSDTMDVWAINVDSDKMYSIATQTDPLVFNAKNVLEMDVVDESGMSVLNSSPTGRYEKFGSILRAWTPEESGLYYVKIWGAPDALAAETDPSYKVRLWYGTSLDVASTTHEPDDEVADASALPAVATDGTVIHGYLYNNYTEGDTFSTNWNDLDLYKVEIPEGMVLIAETTTPGRLYGHPEWIRETDTEITLLDATGAETPIKNDDKDVWAGDPWEDILTFNNTFSRFISPPVPNAGTYYIRVNSYYNSVTRSRNPHESHKNAGGGEYLLSVRVVPADDPAVVAQSLPLNEILDGSISDADTMDVWAIHAESDKMYSIATQTDPLTFNAKSVLQMDVVSEDNVSVLNASPSGRYEKFGCILRAWTPEETGVYYVKLWGAPEELALVDDPSYQMRFWYGTPLEVAGTEHEPDDSVAVASELPAMPLDGSVIHGYLYNEYTEGDTFTTNWNDLDLYKIEVPQAGMILTVETTTPGRLYDHPEWIRETDTEITLLDEDGNETPIKNDDKDVWSGDPWEDILTFNNTFSRFVSPPIPNAGTYYVRVNSYYNSVTRSRNPHESHKNAGGGEYLITASLTSPAEQEPNDDMANANVILLETVTDAALAADDEMDYFKFYADSSKMYTLNTIAPRGETAKNVLKLELFDENGDSVLNADPSGRYERWGARLTGWVPPMTGFYYCKISADVSSFTEDFPYQIRLWYGTPVSVAASTHEPDDSVAVAQNMEAIDLSEPFEIRSYLYADYYDSLGNWYNWNDFDLYKIELNVGDTLVAETVTSGPDSCIRDLDTELYLLDAEGNQTPIKNDDKDVWEGDPWEDILNFNNTFSRFVSPPITEGLEGTYYIQVNSYYNSRIRSRDPGNSHKDPGGGEYTLKIGLKTATSVASREDALPISFELSQNYPNPFNPTTKINYSIPNEEIVKLSIYNMLGQRVAEIVNKRQPSGHYSVVWNATDSNGLLMPSGVYFCKLEAGSFVDIKKLILLK
ncbi:T9SS type A sorting domain-containing protein, partial [candidate division KSB1 bacterium]|nr:T9SS type A sorting domain-containing protein [candidate division KSB1 bacterium]